MKEAGFVVHTEDDRNLAKRKARYNIPVQLQSCHTAIVDGYLIEGHVPRDEILRLLRERPDLLGLSVPGMPIGSPGMEVPGKPAQPYTVFALGRNGEVGVYARYPK
ncbi:MAG: DUF411 domain-containing protein [Desulfuromonadales bacterium]